MNSTKDYIRKLFKEDFESECVITSDPKYVSSYISVMIGDIKFYTYEFYFEGPIYNENVLCFFYKHESLKFIIKNIDKFYDEVYDGRYSISYFDLIKLLSPANDKYALKKYIFILKGV